MDGRRENEARMKDEDEGRRKKDEGKESQKANENIFIYVGATNTAHENAFHSRF